MKLTDITQIKEVVQESVLVEKLGNLAQLGVGPLINVLKQRKGGHGLTPTGKKFEKRWGYEQIGSTSEIVDMGVIKKGIADIRKAYRTIEAGENKNIVAFALYIGNQPVTFAVFDSEALGGSSRTGMLAYDLSAFKTVIDQIDQEANATKLSWQRPSATQVTTARDQEERDWDYRSNEYKKSIKKYQGILSSTGDLKTFIETVMNIATRAKQPVTAKAVLSDRVAIEKQKKRLSNKEIEYGVKDLRTRLAIYKNYKKPTVETIAEFVAMSLKNPGKQVRFAGATYNLKPESAYSSENIKPIDLLQGKSFQIKYRCTDPGAHDSLDLTYAYDPSSNQLKPIFASWYDRSDPATRANRQEGVLDPAGYLKIKLGVTDYKDKDAILKKLLEKFKIGYYYEVILLADSLKKTGVDWPELDTILKSSTIEYEKKKKA